MPANVLYHIAVLSACSDRCVSVPAPATNLAMRPTFHHLTCRTMNAGKIPASKMPKKNRTVARPAKLWQAAIQRMTTPQRNVTAPTKRPICTLLTRYRHGTSAPRYPK